MAFRQTGHKYGTSPKEQRTVDGIVFDSKKEAKRYSELKLLEKAGAISDLKLQVPFSWTEDCYRADVDETETGRHVKKKRSYKADFTYYERRDAGEVYVVEDVKGVRTREYKAKKKIVEALYGIEIKET